MTHFNHIDCIEKVSNFLTLTFWRKNQSIFHIPIENYKTFFPGDRNSAKFCSEPADNCTDQVLDVRLSEEGGAGQGGGEGGVCRLQQPRRIALQKAHEKSSFRATWGF